MFTRVFLSCVLAIATVLGPYASAQRAEAIAPAAVVPYAVGTAFATVASLYGFSVASGDTDFEALGSSVMDAIDNVSVDDFNKGLSAFGTFNPVTSVTSAQSYVKEWLSSAGESGSINLDDLTALGDITSAYLPVILSQILSAGSGSSGSEIPIGTLSKGSITIPVSDFCPITPYSVSGVVPTVYLGSSSIPEYFWADLPKYVSSFSFNSDNSVSVKVVDSTGYIYQYGSGYGQRFSSVYATLSLTSISSTMLQFLLDKDSSLVFNENTDVINPRFDDAAALENVDVLNPGRSQALGSDAVFDGDTLVSHGNIGILNPSDYADIDSWADALAKLRAGILEDINAAVAAGAITLESAVTAALDGVLVTDKVSNLNGKDSGSSISRPRSWKNLGSKFTQLFPFCLYYDMAKCVAFLEAEPVAPVFDWVVPSLWRDKEGNLKTYTIHVDMSPWDSAAGFLRMILTFSFAFGFVFLILKFVNPRRNAGGGD